mmetsp:Transcript_26383/g.63639  ORF Transcript_26383/g.63639 Transcript_26383/m.63639 type:complete len:96 (+) Transcript_26383:1432-1719(+)
MAPIPQRIQFQVVVQGSRSGGLLKIDRSGDEIFRQWMRRSIDETQACRKRCCRGYCKGEQRSVSVAAVSSIRCISKEDGPMLAAMVGLLAPHLGT